jgi:3D (Asp-Asp-Asp) domain-containing protein
VRATPRARRLVVIGYVIVLAWGVWSTRGTDSETGSRSMTPSSSRLWEDAATRVPSPRAIPTRKASRHRTVTGAGVGRLTDTTCYVWTGNRTASGTWPKVGDAASNRYPFGTVLQVEHVGRVVVRDRIGHGSSLDLFFASRAACIRFGRQQLRVVVVR